MGHEDEETNNNNNTITYTYNSTSASIGIPAPGYSPSTWPVTSIADSTDFLLPGWGGPPYNSFTLSGMDSTHDDKQGDYSFVAATDNMMLCGPVSMTGTVTVNGTLTVV